MRLQWNPIFWPTFNGSSADGWPVSTFDQPNPLSHLVTKNNIQKHDKYEDWKLIGIKRSWNIDNFVSWELLKTVFIKYFKLYSQAMQISCSRGFIPKSKTPLWLDDTISTCCSLANNLGYFASLNSCSAELFWKGNSWKWGESASSFCWLHQYWVHVSYPLSMIIDHKTMLTKEKLVSSIYFFTSAAIYILTDQTRAMHWIICCVQFDRDLLEEKLVKA